MVGFVAEVFFPRGHGLWHLEEARYAQFGVLGAGVRQRSRQKAAWSHPPGTRWVWRQRRGAGARPGVRALCSARARGGRRPGGSVGG